MATPRLRHHHSRRCCRPVRVFGPADYSEKLLERMAFTLGHRKCWPSVALRDDELSLVVAINPEANFNRPGTIVTSRQFLASFGERCIARIIAALRP